MALQNIGAANSDDAFYRYKMPRMITKIEGRGNGIKTNVVNMVDIAKALARPASYTTKYFGCELGAQSKFDEKTGISLVNGAHDTAKLAGLLENFIKKYVQCYGCGNPETEVIITKAQMITLKCAACGFVSDVDMRDKLTTFILKNPPETKKAGKDKKGMRRAEKERLKEGEAADVEQKKLKKDAKKKAATNTVATKVGVTKKKAAGSSDEEITVSPPHEVDDAAVEDDDDEDDVQWLTDTSMEAAKQRMQEQLSAATAEMVMLSTNEPEKPKQNGNHQNGGNIAGAECKDANHQNGGKIASAEHNDANHQNGGKIASAEHNDANHQNGGRITPYEELVGEIKAAASVAQLKTLLSSVSLPPQGAMNAVVEGLFFGVGKGFAKKVSAKMSYISIAVQDEGSPQLLLHAIENFGDKCSAEAVKEVAHVLKALYDGDVLEEEAIVRWYKEAVAAGRVSPVLKNAKPFVEWLQNADSESEEE